MMLDLTEKVQFIIIQCFHFIFKFKVDSWCTGKLEYFDDRLEDESFDRMHLKSYTLLICKPVNAVFKIFLKGKLTLRIVSN